MFRSFRSLSVAPSGALAALLLAVLTVTASGGAAQAVDDGTLGIRPAHESDFLHLRALPGETIRDAAVVSNHTTSAVTLLDYPVDAHGSATGTFAMDARTDPRKGVGSWVRLPGDRLVVPAGHDKELPFTLHVPASTPPGDYAGALIIQAPPVIGTTAVHDGRAVRLDVVQRQGLRIYLHVDGTAVKGLSAGPLQWSDTTGGGADFSLPVTNTGNTVLHPAAELAVAGRIGADARLRFAVPRELLPGDLVTLHATLAHRATIEVGTATATVRSEAGTRTVTAAFVAIPAAPIAAGGALVLGLLLILAIRRRRGGATTPRRPVAPSGRPVAPSGQRGRHRAGLAG